METIISRTVDPEGRAKIASCIRSLAGIPSGEKTELYLYSGNDIIYVWNPCFCDFFPPNGGGIVKVTADTIGRFTIPKKIRDDMGISPSDQINCACYGGVLHFWAVKKPVCRLCKSPLGKTLQGLRLCLDCIRGVQGLDLKELEKGAEPN